LHIEDETRASVPRGLHWRSGGVAVVWLPAGWLCGGDRPAARGTGSMDDGGGGGGRDTHDATMQRAGSTWRRVSGSIRAPALP
jgi:hypothetical protein